MTWTKVSMKEIIYGIINIALLILVIAMTITFIDNFAWSESLGFYYTGHYRISLGDIMNGVEPTYIETNLNLFEIIIKIFKIWF